MHRWRYIVVLALLTGLLASCGFRRKKYENPIATNSQQPDKALFDKASFPSSAMESRLRDLAKERRQAEEAGKK